MAEFKIPLERLKKVGIKPEVGTALSIRLRDGKVATAEITKVEKDTVIAISK